MIRISYLIIIIVVSGVNNNNNCTKVIIVIISVLGVWSTAIAKLNRLVTFTACITV